jgi:predicted N-acyltransferase
VTEQAHKTEDANDVIRVHSDPNDIDASAWDALLEQSAQPTPFMRHHYLAALHDSGCAVEDTGWSPCFVTLERRGTLVAAAPAYLKTHSYGEYVFDWAWADAYQRHGLRYYPKLLVAVPFTPVPGSRLLARDAETRRALAGAVHVVAQRLRVSSLHMLFHDEADGLAAADAGWSPRQGVQFHWTTPANGTPPRHFEDLLASLSREKRKKIQQERRRVAEAGVTFSVHEGSAIDEPLWDFFMRCYRLTYRAHHSTPYLNAAFFERMASSMAEHWVLFVAHRAGLPIAVSLIAVDPVRGHAFGRYWGSVEHVPCLHFEACYYQPLAWCIARGYRSFEGGAQGEHKMARGLLPVGTQSAHWLAHPEFARAVDDFLHREAQGIDAYMDELREHSPFKRDSSGG